MDLQPESDLHENLVVGDNGIDRLQILVLTPFKVCWETCINTYALVAECLPRQHGSNQYCGYLLYWNRNFLGIYLIGDILYMLNRPVQDV